MASDVAARTRNLHDIRPSIAQLAVKSQVRSQMMRLTVAKRTAKRGRCFTKSGSRLPFCTFLYAILENTKLPIRGR